MICSFVGEYLREPQVVVTHEAGSGENESRTVSVDVYLNYDDGDGDDMTSLGDMMCSPNRTCEEYSECGGDSAEVVVSMFLCVCVFSFNIESTCIIHVFVLIFLNRNLLDILSISGFLGWGG